MCACLCECVSRIHSNMHFRINLPTWYILHKVNMHFTELFSRWRLYIKRNRNTAPICIFSTKVNSNTTPICILCRIPILNVMCYLQHAAESPHLPLHPPFSPTIPQHPIPTPTPPIMSNICVCYYINCITNREIAEHALPRFLSMTVTVMAATAPQDSRCFNSAKHRHGRRPIYLNF